MEIFEGVAEKEEEEEEKEEGKSVETELLKDNFENCRAAFSKSESGVGVGVGVGVGGGEGESEGEGGEGGGETKGPGSCAVFHGHALMSSASSLNGGGGVDCPGSHQSISR